MKNSEILHTEESKGNPEEALRKLRVIRTKILEQLPPPPIGFQLTIGPVVLIEPQDPIKYCLAMDTNFHETESLCYRLSVEEIYNTLMKGEAHV